MYELTVVMLVIQILQLMAVIVLIARA